MDTHQLTPLPHEIAVFRQFVARQTETLTLQERILSLSGDSFHVTRATSGQQQPLLAVQGKLLTLGARKSVYDMAGTHLFDVHRERLHLHTTHVLEDPQGHVFFELKSRLKVLGSSATATFTSAAGQPVALTMTGSWLDRRAAIVDDGSGAVVAQIDRAVLSARHVLFGQDTYSVVVAPGMDMALVAAMCICLDEKNEQ